MLTEFFDRLKKWLDGAGVKAVDETAERGLDGTKPSIMFADKATTTKKAKILNHSFDKVFRMVKKVEKNIMRNDTEFGQVWDSKNNPLGEVLSSVKADELVIPYSFQQTVHGTMTHNHPLSYHDVRVFVYGGFKELRAIGKNGEVYSLIRKGPLIDGIAFNKHFKILLNSLPNKYPDLYQKHFNGDPVLLQSAFTDDLIEYISTHTRIEYYRFRGAQ